MRKTLLISAAVLTTTLAAPAFAACDTSLSELNTKISENENNYRAVVNGELGNDVRKLRSAARIFDQHGMTDACEETVASINEMIEQRAEEMKADSSATDTWFEDEVAKVKSAVPVDQITKPLRAAEVVGADVRNLANEDLGQIDDVIVDPKTGDLNFAIVSHGGFLGLGEKQIAVPWRELRVTESGETPVFVLNVSEEALEDAPSFARDSWGEIDNEKWREENDTFYMKNRIE
jgi:sporulation protein YlmC with PRC-barrel domain